MQFETYFDSVSRTLLAEDEAAFRAMQKAAVDYWTSINKNKLVPIGGINGIISAGLAALRRYHGVER